MSSSTINKEALALPLEERAKPVEKPLESLDDLPEKEAELHYRLRPDAALEFVRSFMKAFLT